MLDGIEGYLSEVLSYGLGAVSPYIYRKIGDAYERRKARISRRFNVVVIEDSLKQRRHCFWRDIYKDAKYRNVRLWARLKFMCIAVELEKKRNPALHLFDKKTTEYIVVNWCAINGDPVYGADKAQALFKHYISDMAAWIRQGGIILVEAQHASLVPMQEVYDIFSRCFQGSNIKVTSEQHMTGEQLKINSENRNHPVLEGVNEDSLRIEHNSLGRRKKWFSTDTATASIIEWASAHGSVCSGWFETYEGWDSLILTGENHPVMIYRTASEGGSVGACVLTTMYIASSEFLQLIENLIRLPLRVRDTVKPRAALPARSP